MKTCFAGTVPLLLVEIAAPDAVGELPIPKKCLAVLAVALAVPQFSKWLLADVANVVVKARIDAPRRRDIQRGPRGDARVSGRLELIGVVLKNRRHRQLGQDPYTNAGLRCQLLDIVQLLL